MPFIIRSQNLKYIINFNLQLFTQLVHLCLIRIIFTTRSPKRKNIATSFNFHPNWVRPHNLLFHHTHLVHLCLIRMPSIFVLIFYFQPTYCCSLQCRDYQQLRGRTFIAFSIFSLDFFVAFFTFCFFLFWLFLHHFVLLRVLFCISALSSTASTASRSSCCNFLFGLGSSGRKVSARGQLFSKTMGKGVHDRFRLILEVELCNLCHFDNEFFLSSLYIYIRCNSSNG